MTISVGLRLIALGPDKPESSDIGAERVELKRVGPDDSPNRVLLRELEGSVMLGPDTVPVAGILGLIILGPDVVPRVGILGVIILDPDSSLSVAMLGAMILDVISVGEGPLATLDMPGSVSRELATLPLGLVLIVEDPNTFASGSLVSIEELLVVVVDEPNKFASGSFVFTEELFVVVDDPNRFARGSFAFAAGPDANTMLAFFTGPEGRGSMANVAPLTDILT